MPAQILRRARGAPPLATSSVRLLAGRMLQALDLEHAELSVLLTDDRTIVALNREHRGKDRATDVLAFPLDEDSDESERWLGDVVISLDTALRQARARRRPLLEEVRFLLAHGLLHLVGFDHATRAQKRSMDRMTRRLVNAAAGNEKHQGFRVNAGRSTKKPRSVAQRNSSAKRRRRPRPKR